MSLDRVPSGKDVPNDCNVIVETPMWGDPINYEVDKETGAVRVGSWVGAEEAKREILESIERCRHATAKPRC